MAEETNTTPSQERPEGAGRGPRSGGGNRDNGGFRIRLSDNEMQAARALQEAFGLRSTVAVLGFALRTLAQQLEEGQLQELVARLKAQGGGRPPGARRERDGERPERGERRERGERGERGERRGAAERAPRVDPFARPARPAPAAASADAEPEAEADLEASAAELLPSDSSESGVSEATETTEPVQAGEPGEITAAPEASLS